MRIYDKIAIVAHGAQNGGAGRVSSILANYLADQGYDVLYVAFFYNKVDYELDSRIKYVALDIKSENREIKLLQRNYKIYQQIKTFAPNVIVSFMANVMLLSALLTNIPVIYSPRNDPNKMHNNFIGKNISIFLYKHAKSIVFQTPGARDYFPDEIRKKGVVIGNPLVDGLPYWNVHGHQKYVIAACRLSEQKNIPLLLNAFARFHVSHTDYILKICGDGPLKKELEAQCKDLGISDAVQFLGFRSDVHELMANAEIFALSSDFEGLSNSMLEALAIGVPMVCTDYTPGGAALYITNHENGMLTPLGDVEKFYNAMSELAENEDLQIQISQNAIKIRQELSAEKICEQWERLINRE